MSDLNAPPLGGAFFFQSHTVIMQIRSSLFVSICLLGNVGFAYADQDLLQKKNCFACHGMDKRKYGPNFMEVSSKYADNTKAVEMLAKKIRSGGSGVWGEDLMPPQPQVSSADARALARYILSLK